MKTFETESEEIIVNTNPQDPNMKLALNLMSKIQCEMTKIECIMSKIGRSIADIKDNMISKSDLKYLHRFVQNPRGIVIPMKEIAEIIFSDPLEEKYILIKDIINNKVPENAYKYLTEYISDDDDDHF